jgi:alkylation response protein AidB-like acyl-CoA dehydrogenase
MQHWRYRLAERATELGCVRNLNQKAALRVDGGARHAESEASMAKFFAT